MNAPLQSRWLSSRAPFRADLSRHEVPVHLTGALPDWLLGRVIRTAPALFELGGWRAGHWFDGLGMFYAFELAAGGVVHFRQRQLDSQVARAPARAGGFGTPLQRSTWERLFQPVPPLPDNTNVNIVPLGDELVAMTETSHQYVVDPRTLETRGRVRWGDTLQALNTLAHPHLDVARGQVVQLGSLFGASPQLVVVEHEPASRVRREVGRWARSRLPYAHSFGLTPRHVVLLGQPLTVNPLTMLWSNKGFIEHFEWRPGEGTRLALMDRATGAIREHQADAMFVFHTVNAFEDGQDTVLDVAAYADAGIVQQLSTASLSVAGFPDFRAIRFLRLRMTPGTERAQLSPLTASGFEFPIVNYRRSSGSAYRFAWGARLWDSAEGMASQLVKVDVESGRDTVFEEPGFIFGEPLFVARPGATAEDDGVLLSVGTRRDGQRSGLQVLDAAKLTPLARAEVEVPIPLGFHGSFVRARGQA